VVIVEAVTPSSARSVAGRRGRRGCSSSVLIRAGRVNAWSRDGFSDPRQCRSSPLTKGGSTAPASGRCPSSRTIRADRAPSPQFRALHAGLAAVKCGPVRGPPGTRGEGRSHAGPPLSLVGHLFAAHGEVPRIRGPDLGPLVGLAGGRPQQVRKRAPCRLGPESVASVHSRIWSDRECPRECLGAAAEAAARAHG